MDLRIQMPRDSSSELLMNGTKYAIIHYTEGGIPCSAGRGGPLSARAPDCQKKPLPLAPKGAKQGVNHADRHPNH